MKLWTKEQHESNENAKICYICNVIFIKKSLKINMWKIKNIVKLEIIVIILENIGELHIVYVVLNLV